MRVSVIRFQLDRFCISARGAGNFAQCFENGAEIVVGLGAGAALDCFGDELGGVAVVAGLMGKDPEQMQRIDLIRIGGKNLAINRFRIRESSGAVMLKRGFN